MVTVRIYTVVNGNQPPKMKVRRPTLLEELTRGHKAKEKSTGFGWVIKRYDVLLERGLTFSGKVSVQVLNAFAIASSSNEYEPNSLFMNISNHFRDCFCSNHVTSTCRLFKKDTHLGSVKIGTTWRAFGLKMSIVDRQGVLLVTIRHVWVV